jgi:putative Holliday junction resolvase
MGRIIAIDYGLKRVGLAVTDPLRIIATALDTVPSDTLYKYLAEYFERETVDSIVLGMPTKLDTSDTDITQKVREVERTLRKKFPAKDVILQDERFTSRMAMDAMIAGGMKKKQRRNKANIDKISATLILQNYLESKKL